MFKIEKRWGYFEFEITGIKEEYVFGEEEISDSFIETRLYASGMLAKTEIINSKFVRVDNAREIGEKLMNSIINEEFYQLNSTDMRIYVIPPMYEVDINTPDGEAEVFKSEYGEKKPVITIAVKLDRDEEYEELYPNNEFIPNIQIQLEHRESQMFVEYINKRIDEVLRLSIN